MPRHHCSRWPIYRTERVPPVYTLPTARPPRRSQAKAGTNALPQGAFFLDTNQGLEAFPVRIQKHDGRIAHPMAVGKCHPLRSIEVRQHKGYSPVKLSPERVDDTLELSAVRSARQKYLHNGWLLAEDVEPTIPGLAGQCHDGHDGGNHHRSGNEQYDASAHTAVPSCRGLMPDRFLRSPREPSTGPP